MTQWTNKMLWAILHHHKRTLRNTPFIIKFDYITFWANKSDFIISHRNNTPPTRYDTETFEIWETNLTFSVSPLSFPFSIPTCHELDNILWITPRSRTQQEHQQIPQEWIGIYIISERDRSTTPDLTSWLILTLWRHNPGFIEKDIILAFTFTSFYYHPSHGKCGVVQRSL